MLMLRRVLGTVVVAASVLTVAATDPARLTFAPGTTGLVLVPVKAARTADYEDVITALKTALAAAPEADRAMAAGWQVFKAKEPDARGNVIYVHALLPVVPGADYRPSILLDMLLKDAPVDLLARYKEAFAAPPSKLSLTELGVMSAPPPKP